MEIPHITCEHLATLNEAEEPAHTVVDLRDPLEFDSGHIEGSVNVPRKELITNIESVIPHVAHHVIVVVGAQHESEIEAIHEELKEMGYEKVEFLSGGFDRWCEISMPSIDDITGEETPEERGFVRREDEEDSYEGDDAEEENEPLM